MSDQSADSGRQKPSIIELMGGQFAAIILLALLAGIVLIDTTQLPALMEMKAPPRYFSDPCRRTIGPAGGFALALCCIIVIALLGLHLFWRRSFALTAVLAIIFLILQFYIIASLRGGDLDNFISSATAGPFHWYHNLPSGRCAEASFADAFYARYKAVSDATAEFPTGGVQREFTIMLQFNLATAALVTLLIWVAGGLRWLLGLLSRVVGKNPRFVESPAINSARFGLPERTILLQTSVLTLLAVLAMPLIILSVEDPTPKTSTIVDVIWAPALLFLLDLARWALWTASDTLTAPTARTAAVATPKLVLAPVVEELRRSFGPELKTFIELPADETRRDTDQATPSSLRQGQGLFIEETLSARHFDLIAKTVNEEILDRGHTVLIICPEEHLDRTEEILYTLLGSGKSRGVRPRIWRIGQDARRMDGAVDVLITSQFSLETLASNVENYRNELRLLGGTVALNLHEADFGLLDIALDRLKAAIPDQDKLIGIFHSEPRRDMITRAENFAISQDGELRPATTARFERTIQQWVMVLDCKASSQLNSKANLPVGYRALIAVAEKEGRAKPFVFDASATYSALNWQNVSDRLLINESQTLLSRLNAMRHTAILPEQTAHSVALVDDKGNLADAVSVMTSTPAAHEALKIVTLGSYPMARFFSKKLDELLAKASDSKSKRDALKTFKDLYGSLAGKPRQGPRELATKIRMIFRAEANAAAAKHDSAVSSEIMKLSQSRVARFLDRSEQFPQQLRINTSKGGLQRLFRTAFRLRPGETVVSVRAADAVHVSGGKGLLRIKNFVLSGPPAVDEDAVPSLAIRGLADHHLPLSDHGLTYAATTRLWVGGNFLTVEQVDLNNRVIHCSTRNTEPVHPYHFVRDYALQLKASDRNNFAVEAFLEERACRQPFELITGYVDCAARTYQIYEYGTMRFPFGAGGITPNRTATHAVSHAQMRSATMLRVLGDATASPQAARGRRSRGVVNAIRQVDNTLPQTGQISFTLCMTLQDVLASQFPSHAHRLAVICPQASDVAAISDPSSLDSFVIERLRHMVSLGENGLPIERAGPATVPSELTKAYESFSTDLSELGRRAQGDVAPPRSAQLSLLLIEDSDHDLGVAQAFFDQKDRIFALWRDFLRDIVENASAPAETGYDFGSGALPTVFDFQGALGVVEALCDAKR